MTIIVDDALADDTEVELCCECEQEISSAEVALNTSDGMAHADCAFTCERCGDIEPNGNQHYNYSDYCDSCGDNMTDCDNCGEPESIYDTRAVWTSIGEREFCESCVQSGDVYYCDRHDEYHDQTYSCGQRNIEDYSYKPSPIFHGVEFDHDFDRHLFMGFELEVEDYGESGNGVNYIKDILGNLAYYKHDGSLDDGFEIVTHPMTLEYAHQMDWSWLKALRDAGYRSWDTSTCGLHVHVDRRAFSGRKHQYAFTLLLMRNKALSYLIAGREGNDYARFDKSYRLEIPKYMKGKPNDVQRYTAVNVLNRATLEVRMFRGSLKRERILAALEYVHSAVDYSRDVKTGSESAEYLTSPAFIQWIRRNSAKYPNLTQYINDSTEFGFNDKARVHVDYRGE